MTILQPHTGRPRSPERALRPSNHVRGWATGVVVATLAATLLPMWQGRMLGLGSFAAIPGYWRSAATAVDEAAARRGGSTLLLPASRSGIYVWGRPDDEPLAALASSPVVVRDAVMLGAPGAARILDVVDLLASSGSRQEGLAPALARMGVARVVVRHDLAWQTLAEDPALVERTLARSPGFERLERLGRRQGGVSVWQVDGVGGAVAAYPAERVVRVKLGVEELTEEFLGRVVHHLYLFDDNALLIEEVGGLESR